MSDNDPDNFIHRPRNRPNPNGDWDALLAEVKEKKVYKATLIDALKQAGSSPIPREIAIWLTEYLEEKATFQKGRKPSALARQQRHWKAMNEKNASPREFAAAARAEAMLYAYRVRKVLMSRYGMKPGEASKIAIEKAADQCGQDEAALASDIKSRSWRSIGE